MYFPTDDAVLSLTVSTAASTQLCSFLTFCSTLLKKMNKKIRLYFSISPTIGDLTYQTYATVPLARVADMKLEP